MASEMFGISSPEGNEMIDVNPRGCSLKIRVLLKEYQHTCKSTGSRLMADVLARNPTIVAGKRMLELGCGCGGICSMVAARSADLMVAIDGDPKALELLNRNVTSNLKTPFVDKLIRKRLEWGNRDHIEAIKEVNKGGFEVILLISSSNKDIREDHLYFQLHLNSVLGFSTDGPSPVTTNPSKSIINSWFSENGSEECIPSSALIKSKLSIRV